MSYSREHGTSAASSSASASFAGNVRVQAAIAASSGVRFAQRSPFVAYNGSRASSGRPIAVISRPKIRSEFPAMHSHRPSAQG